LPDAVTMLPAFSSRAALAAVQDVRDVGRFNPVLSAS
jgi:hypothetical protein